MYHPAAALHQPKWRQVVEEDMSKIPDLLARADTLADVKPPADAQQLSLF